MIGDPRKDLVEICHLLAARNFTTSTGGNVSVRLPDGTFWVTPSQLPKSRVTVDDLVRINDDLCVVEGTRQPSSETLVHLALYRTLPQAEAVIHAHSPYANGFAQACRPIPTTSSSEGYVVLGDEVPLIQYAAPGTRRLADLVMARLDEKHHAYLLANHGSLTWGTSLWESYDIVDTLELFAQSVVVATILGGAVALRDDDLQQLLADANPAVQR